MEQLPDLARANLKNQLERALDENGYLRPISNPGNSSFVEDVKYLEINREINHQYINNKRGEINNAMAIS